MAAKAEDGIDYRPKRWARGLAAALLAIGIGAVIGAWLRWGLGPLLMTGLGIFTIHKLAQ